jgi:hypothetical protein
MNEQYLYFMLALGAILSVLGLFYTLAGVFYARVPRSEGSFSGTSKTVRGSTARILGFLLFLTGLPLLAFGYGATQSPNESWYGWMLQYVTAANYMRWFFGFAIAAIVIHAIAFFAGTED